MLIDDAHFNLEILKDLLLDCFDIESISFSDGREAISAF